MLALGDEDGTVTLVDAETRARLGKPIQASPSGSPVNDLAFSPDGRLTVTTVEGISFVEPGGLEISDTIALPGERRIPADAEYSDDGKAWPSSRAPSIPTRPVSKTSSGWRSCSVTVTTVSRRASRCRSASSTGR